MLRNFPLDKTNVTKTTLYIPSQVSTHHSYTFDLQFLYELKHKVLWSKNVGKLSIFDSVSFFIFVQQKA